MGAGGGRGAEMSFSKAQEGSIKGCASQGSPGPGRANPDALSPHAITSEGPLRTLQYQGHMGMRGGKQVQN